MDENSQSCKKSKCWFLSLKSQTFTGFIFKYDLNLEKINMDSCSGGRNQPRWKMVKSQNVDFWLEKSKFDFDFNGQMTILPIDKSLLDNLTNS